MLEARISFTQDNRHVFPGYDEMSAYEVQVGKTVIRTMGWDRCASSGCTLDRDVKDITVLTLAYRYCQSPDRCRHSAHVHTHRNRRDQLPVYIHVLVP